MRINGTGMSAASSSRLVVLLRIVVISYHLAAGTGAFSGVAFPVHVAFVPSASLHVLDVDVGLHTCRRNGYQQARYYSKKNPSRPLLLPAHSALSSDPACLSYAYVEAVANAASNGRCLTILEERWYGRFHELKEYKRVYGDCNVPRGWEENPGLGKWVGNQRYHYMRLAIDPNCPKKKQKSFITPERIRALESIGFEWVLVKRTEWDIRYDELKKYRAKYGHCNVPQQWKENPQLGRWVSRQRHQYKLFMSEDPEENEKSRITPVRINALESIGFEWVSISHVEWEVRYEELKEYKAKYGDCNVPIEWSENPQLGRWVGTQRTQYRLYQEGKKSTVTKERIAALESINFQWRVERGRPPENKEGRC